MIGRAWLPGGSWRSPTCASPGSWSRSRRRNWGAACFHAQQAGEKALKALLEAHERPVPRTHDLALLLDVLRDVESVGEIEDEPSSCRHSAKPRYPMPEFTTTERDAEGAVEAARRILAWVAVRVL